MNALKEVISLGAKEALLFEVDSALTPSTWTTTEMLLYAICRLETVNGNKPYPN